MHDKSAVSLMEALSQITDDLAMMMATNVTIAQISEVVELSELNPELITNSKGYVTMLQGSSFVHLGDSFVIVRHRYIDIVVLDILQIASHRCQGRVYHHRSCHQTREPKIVAELTYPATGLKCVDRINTDLCVFDVTSEEGLTVIEKVDGLSFAELQRMTSAPLMDATH